MKIQLTADEERLLAKTRTVDPEALVAYMKGQFHWERLGKANMDSALHYFEITIEKDPDWADPYAGMAMTWNAIGGFAYGPLRPLVLALYGRVMNREGDHQAALIHAEKALSINPDNRLALSPLSASFLAIGDTLKWYETVRRYYRTDNEHLASLDRIFQEGGFLAVIKENIRVNEELYIKGGSISFTGQAGNYLIMKDYDKAMDYYEKACEERFWQLAYLSVVVIEHPELKENPRYIALLKKMNLPVE